MAKRPHFEPVFQRLIDDPVGALAHVRADPSGFESEAFDEERGSLRADAAIPSLASIAALVFDEEGAILGKFGPP